MTAKCPLMGDCAEHACRWYTLLQGKHPQTGADIDRWGCAVEFLPMLLCENTKYVREAVQMASEGNETNKQALKSAALREPTPELKRILGITDGHSH